MTIDVGAVLGIIFGTPLLCAVGMGIVAFLSREWISTRIRESVAAEYRNELGRLKDALGWETRRRAQAAQVAEVISLWERTADTSDEDARTRLNRIYSELALWLDRSALRELNKCLSYSEGVTAKSALIAARKVIVGVADDIEPGELVYFPRAAR